MGGLLTADQVDIGDSNGWSHLIGLEFEQTYWVRWDFDGIKFIVTFPDYLEQEFLLAAPDILRPRAPEWPDTAWPRR